MFVLWSSNGSRVDTETYSRKQTKNEGNENKWERARGRKRELELENFNTQG